MTGPDQKEGLAVACSLSAMALFGLIDNFMRLAADTGSLWQFHLICAVVALVVLYGAARVMKRPLAMLCTGALGVAAMSVFVSDPPAGADGYVWRGWVPFAGAFMVITLMQGVGSLIGVGLIIRSYQLAKASFLPGWNIWPLILRRYGITLGLSARLGVRMRRAGSWIGALIIAMQRRLILPRPALKTSNALGIALMGGVA